MTRPSAFGTLVSAYDVELALRDHGQLWIADYLAEVDRLHAQLVATLPQPRSWVISSEVEKMPEDQTPAVVIASPGLTDPPRADGQGIYWARWRVNVGAHVSAKGNVYALRLARLYVLALRALYLQQQVISDALSIRRIDWADERYDTLPSVDDRTVCTAVVELAVEVAGVTQRHAGPFSPILPPGQPLDPDSPTWPVAEIADAAVTKEPLS
jgi:hypothetical protein